MPGLRHTRYTEGTKVRVTLRDGTVLFGKYLGKERGDRVLRIEGHGLVYMSEVKSVAPVKGEVRGVLTPPPPKRQIYHKVAQDEGQVLKEGEMGRVQILGFYYLIGKELLYVKSISGGKYEPERALMELRNNSKVESIWAWTGEKAIAWIILIEAWALGADRDRIRGLMKKWNMGPWDIPFLQADLGVEVSIEERDGSWWAKIEGEQEEIGEDPMEALGKVAMRGLKGRRIERT